MIIGLLLIIASPLLIPLAYGVVQILKHLLAGGIQFVVQLGAIVIGIYALALAGIFFGKMWPYIVLVMKGLFVSALIGAIVAYLATYILERWFPLKGIED